MKYYKHNGVVFAYESDGSQNQLIDAEAVEMTTQEIDSHLSPLPTSGQLAELAKLKGVMYGGVMCSATGKDQAGLLAVDKYIADYGVSVNFLFSNGNVLVLDTTNIAAFKAVWVPFRAAFFAAA